MLIEAVPTSEPTRPHQSESYRRPESPEARDFGPSVVLLTRQRPVTRRLLLHRASLFGVLVLGQSTSFYLAWAGLKLFDCVCPHTKHCRNSKPCLQTISSGDELSTPLLFSRSEIPISSVETAKQSSPRLFSPPLAHSHQT